MKNNVTRLLTAHNIQYHIHDLPEEKFDAGQLASLIGVQPEVVYKTIVLIRLSHGKPILAVIPGPNEVDLKLLAKALGEKKVKLATERQAEKITGLQAGGISPLALLNRSFQIVMDNDCLTHQTIYISGGRRGLIINLSPQDIIKLSKAKIAIISK
jgi:Cys-tRNA(Pro)/Cys-tRNA(Cys) deacylase